MTDGRDWWRQLPNRVPNRVREVIERAAAAQNIPPAMVLKGSNHAVCVRARRQAIHEMRGFGYSTPRIGRLLGGLHHTTILHHLAKPLAAPPAPYDFGSPDESGLWA